MFSRLSLPILFLALAGGCSSDVNPVRDVFVATGVGAEPKKAEDFVVKSRPTGVDYVPVGTSAPARAIPAKSVPFVKAAEAEMDALRTANETRAAETRQVGAAVQPAQKPVVPPLQ